MGKKAPFWVFVEELADRMRKGAHPLSFPEIRQMADREWPTLTDEERGRYKMLARQDRIAVPVIRYEPPPPQTKPQQNTPEVPDYSHVLSKFFTLVDTPSETTIADGGEIALAGFSLSDGVSQFLSAHLIPRAAYGTTPVRRQLQLPITQKSSIIVSSSSEILTEISQFCACEQCSAGRIVLFASRSKVETLRGIFAEMLEFDGSGLSIIVEPIEKLIGVIHVALSHQTDEVDLAELSRTSDDILRRSAGHRRVPCSRHRAADSACAHGGVCALVFSFINAFIDDLKTLGVNTDTGKHSLRLKTTTKQANGISGKAPQKLEEPTNHDIATGDPMAVVPGRVVFVPGRGRIRTVSKFVPWKDFKDADDGSGEMEARAEFV